VVSISEEIWGTYRGYEYYYYRMPGWELWWPGWEVLWNSEPPAS